MSDADDATGPDPAVPPGAGRTRLVVIYGGRSAEHEVSCISALHVVRAADPALYDVALVGITTAGRWVDAGGILAALPPGTASLPSPDTAAAGAPRPPAAIGGAPGTQALVAPGSGGSAGGDDPGALLRADGDETTVVFPLLHGPHGEDGTIQGLLEVAGVAYVGAGVASSAASMDKGLTKALLRAAGLPQVRSLVLRDHELDDLTAKRVEAELGWPVFVKPANLGSSIGITRAGDADELAAAVDLALRYDEWIVVEEAVAVREIEIGVLGYGDSLRASVPGEVVASHDFYDFEDKYLAGTASSVIPADLEPDVADAARALALDAARAVRVDGMARVDLFYEEGGRGLMVNEINTIPGFTPISQFPLLWAASGLEGPALIDELVGLALARHRRRARFDGRRILG